MAGGSSKPSRRNDTSHDWRKEEQARLSAFDRLGTAERQKNPHWRNVKLGHSREQSQSQEAILSREKILRVGRSASRVGVMGKKLECVAQAAADWSWLTRVRRINKI